MVPVPRWTLKRGNKLQKGVCGGLPPCGEQRLYLSSMLTHPSWRRGKALRPGSASGLDQRDTVCSTLLCAVYLVHSLSFQNVKSKMKTQ